MSEDPIKTEKRRAKRELMVGRDQACASCGISDLFALRRFEEHHAAGKAHDPNLTVVLCLNCHALATEAQRQEGVDLTQQLNPIEVAAQALKSLLAFFRLLCDGFERFIEGLSNEVARLDREHPSWRLSCPTQ